MHLFDVIAVLLTLTALFSYFNQRYLLLHPSIGVMLVALVLSLALIVLGKFGFGLTSAASQFLSHIQFGEALLQWMLGFLLFAGALTVDINELSRHWRFTTLLATAGTVASMFIVAGLSWILLKAIGIRLPWLNCMLLGALISPTDPIAVVAVMKRAGAPKGIQTIVSAESLFNDGVGVVLFLTLLEATHADAAITVGGILKRLGLETFGGAALGLATGLIVYQLLRRALSFQVEVLLTLALVMGTYSLAGALGMSAPITVVTAGLLIGNRGRVLHLAKGVNDDLSRFWELIDEVLNAVLFVLIGLEVLVMPFLRPYIAAAILSIPIVLLARGISVAGSVMLLPASRRPNRSMVAILIWGSLRGGLAVAMALSLPADQWHDLIVAITYAVVCFSIFVQGTTIRRLALRGKAISLAAADG